jgi:hypothetical protein
VKAARALTAEHAENAEENLDLGKEHGLYQNRKSGLTQGSDLISDL